MNKHDHGIGEWWDTKLNICRYYDLLKSNHFETKEKPWKYWTRDGVEYSSSNSEYFVESKRLKREKERLLRTQFFIIEKTDYSYQWVKFYDFELAITRSTTLQPLLSLPSGVIMVVPSSGLGQQNIRDIHGYPWEKLKNFKGRETYDYEKVDLD